MEGSTDSQLLIQFLEGGLSPAEQAKFQARLKVEPALEKELQQWQDLYAEFDQQENTPVPQRVDEGFYAFLDQVQNLSSTAPSRSVSLYWKWAGVAAGILVLITLVSSIYLNWTQQRQLAEMQGEIEKTQRMLILSMLENPSASNRMQAVGVSLQQTQGDDEMLEALQQVLDYDPNVNVRLKAASALADFVEEPAVIGILIASLEKQTLPQVQIALIDILTAARKKEAVNAFHKLLEQEELMDIVRDKAAEGIGILL
ncbi:MAG: HEAT repeat domain-containing protein [Saprospiraceae bacterium]|nr:HEAT repeat domain-containing protein [Saprospiraceae bacterium]